VDAKDYQRIVGALTAALDGYTTDQRGDVGSWVRGGAMRALADIISGVAGSEAALSLVPQDAFVAATAGIAKQGVEKLDALREVATQAWNTLLATDADKVWAWPAARDMDGKAPTDWFTSGLALLGTPARTTFLAGLVQSAGMSVRSGADRALSPLVAYLKSTPASIPDVLADIAALLASNLASNRIAVPALTTLARLVSSVPAFAPEATYARILGLAARGVPTLKSIDRIAAGMRATLACVSLPPSFETRARAADGLAPFLAHRFPRIRAMTAEALYLVLAEDDVEPELEEALLETHWAEEEGVSRAPDVVEMLKSSLE
jgi:hypothetical protein